MGIDDLGYFLAMAFLTPFSIIAMIIILPIVLLHSFYEWLKLRITNRIRYDYSEFLNSKSYDERY